MLSREDAEKRLKKYEHKKYTSRVTKRMMLKPWIMLSKLGKLFDKSENMNYQYSSPSQTADLAEMLDSLTPQKRIQFFSCFQPRMAEDLEAMWNKLTQCPYTSGWSRRAFRAPDHPELTRCHRGSKLKEILSSLAGYEEDIE